MTHPTPITASPLYTPAEAAPAGAAVVLYTTSVDSRIADRTLATLRDFATQQGWTVTHEAYDLAPLHLPARLRTGWRTVEHLLATGEAAGLVVPAEHEVATTPAEQTALREWLLSLPAFAAYPHAGHHRALPPVNDPSDAPAPVSVLTVPVDREWSQSYAMIPASLRRLRDDARMRLTLLRWPGDIVTAIEVLSRLAYNAAVHARPADETLARMTIRLAVTENEALLIDVQDPRPDVPLSQAAIDGEKGRGLKYARLLGATVSCFLSEDTRLKTVRAQLPPSEVSL
ncbi:ATP-binding protein [Streptomyces gossypiisoli]|uniref:ATP-binding protein n=1 Tax=Streptomyces gossypiisoli TaxID=2748864 RepID=UPI0015D9BE8A|nr:ATP-binding protein [Streptomyces gossypiisoli]